jgi:hypothetical protein
MIILGILGFAFLGTFAFCVKGHDMLNKKIYMLIESIMKKEELTSSLDSNKNIHFRGRESDMNRLQSEIKSTEQRKSTTKMSKNIQNHPCFSCNYRLKYCTKK